MREWGPNNNNWLNKYLEVCGRAYSHSLPIQSVGGLNHKQRSYLWEQDLQKEETNEFVNMKVLGKAHKNL